MAKASNGRPPPGAESGGSAVSAPALLSAALAHHQAGRLDAAEPIYRQILAIDPTNADALNLFGVLAHQVGRHDVAVELIGRAIRIHPREPSYFHNLGAALLDLGRHEEMAEAFRRAIDLAPGAAEAHFNLAVALQALGRLDEAADAYRRVIKLQPNHALAHSNLGAVLKSQGKLEEAAQSLGRAADLQPNNAAGHNNLGVVLEELGRPKEALTSYQRAVALKPDFAAAHYNLGSALQALHRLGEAEASYRRAIALRSDHAEAFNNLGAVLVALDRPEEALECYRRAVDLKPDYAEACLNLAVGTQRAGLHDQAAGFYQRAAELTPDDPKIEHGLGVALQDAGRPLEAAEAFARAVALKPDFVEADSHRLLALGYTDISAQALLVEHLKWAERHGGGPGPARTDYANPADPERRLRIGFVSADFNFHPVGIYLTKVLMARDPQAMEVFCYYNNTNDDDEFTGLLRRSVDEWRVIVGLSDEDAEAIIRQDEIDILVDLSGHTGGHRLQLFARRPAPVQASWLGYPSTTGLSAIDYLLMDAAAVPAGAERFCSEAVVRLPYGRFCYTPPAYAPEPIDPASREGAPITFGSFNNLAKIGPPVIRAVGRGAEGDARIAAGAQVESPGGFPYAAAHWPGLRQAGHSRRTPRVSRPVAPCADAGRIRPDRHRAGPLSVLRRPDQLRGVVDGRSGSDPARRTARIASDPRVPERHRPCGVGRVLRGRLRGHRHGIGGGCAAAGGPEAELEGKHGRLAPVRSRPIHPGAGIGLPRNVAAVVRRRAGRNVRRPSGYRSCGPQSLRLGTLPKPRRREPVESAAKLGVGALE